MLSHALHASFADSADLRVSDRRVLRLDAQVGTPMGDGGLQVQNLSRSGLLLEGLAGISTGCEIEVELPGGKRHRAEVVWADETLFGCRFLTQLTQAELSAALLRSDPVAPAAMPDRLSQTEAFARLREHWEDEPGATSVSPKAHKLPLRTRLLAISGLAVAGWAVPAAAAWMFW